MLRRIVFAMVFVMFAFNMCIAQEMTLADIRVKIANTQQEYDRFIQMEPKTLEINDKIKMLDQKLFDLRRMESKLEDAAISQPVVEKPAEVTPVSTPKASSYSSNKKSTSPQNISEATGSITGSGSSLSDTFSQPTVMAATISAFAVIFTALLGIFAKRK